MRFAQCCRAAFASRHGRRVAPTLRLAPAARQLVRASAAEQRPGMSMSSQGMDSGGIGGDAVASGENELGEAVLVAAAVPERALRHAPSPTEK